MRARNGNKIKLFTVIVLLLAVVGLAHAIEVTARPDTGKQGQHVAGESEHEH